MNMRKAFTLIELMIVVAIIGILAAIAMPKFSILVDKSKEGYTKGALANIRSTLSVYYSDNEGIFPVDDLAVLTANGKYLSAIPLAKLPGTGHQNSDVVTAATDMPGLITDAGGWTYLNNPANNEWGRVAVNCLHADVSAAPWSTF